MACSQAVKKPLWRRRGPGPYPGAIMLRAFRSMDLTRRVGPSLVQLLVVLVITQVVVVVAFETLLGSVLQ
jgi:hypothetical protein